MALKIQQNMEIDEVEDEDEDEADLMNDDENKSSNKMEVE